MIDIYSKIKRSKIMSSIPSKNTLPEKQVFSYLKKNNISFRRHYVMIAGRPDIAIPSKKLAIFIEGDFWHGWRFNSWSERISDFWKKKISDNIRRDNRNIRKLRRYGWRVLRIWEHDLDTIRKREATLEKVRIFVECV